MNPFEELVGFQFGLDQFIVLGIIIAALVGNKGFFRDWVPFLILWFTYDLMRTLADDHKHINVRPIYDLELKLFGWMFDGKIPAFWAQSYQNPVLSGIAAIFYSLHMAMPIIVASLIYYKSNDRELFKEFSYAFLITSYMALLTFYFYPVAPPWYIWNDGNGLNFDQPTILVGIPGSAAGLIEVDRLLGRDIFSRFYGRFNANPYAALPSLHAAYAFISTYYLFKKYGRKKVWWFIFYPIGVLTSAVYLNHHYIVDLILGIIYVIIAINITHSIQKLKAGRKKPRTEQILESLEEEDNGKPRSDIKEQILEEEIKITPTTETD